MEKNYQIEKINKSKVVSLLEDIESKKVEIVNMTPFDLYEDNLALKIIDQRLESIYELINSNAEITHQYVKKVILPIQNTLESMDHKLNDLLPKAKSTKSTLLLRDAVTKELFEIFVNAAGSHSKYRRDLRCAQLKIAYTILFYTGLRVNEIRCFQEHDIENAIKTSQFSVVHFKQNQPHIHVISDIAVKELKKLKSYCKIIFVKYKFKYLFGKDKPLDNKYFIKIINKDLKNTCQINKIPYNIKSHSFRINMITNLLKHTSVQDTADIIGHKDTKSTMAYKRYVLNKTEILNLLNKIDKLV